FLGEAARIVGNVCRALTRRDEARRWLETCEVWFLRTGNAAGNLAKLSYVRLALLFEEREHEAVLRSIPQLIDDFERLGMTEDALRCKIVRGGALKETDRLQEAIVTLNRAAAEARSLGNEHLLAHALVNLVQIYGFLGELQNASPNMKEAEALLRKLGSHAPLAKLQWGIAYLLRTHSDFAGAIRAYRSAQHEFATVGMHADVAAVQLQIADVLLDQGQDKQAEWEIRQALPIIDEYKLVPEGVAALSLLRESLRRQKIDRQALRNLHGYFEELSS